jgi:hypothetical protein
MIVKNINIGSADPTVWTITHLAGRTKDTAARKRGCLESSKCLIRKYNAQVDRMVNNIETNNIDFRNPRTGAKANIPIAYPGK